MSQSAGGLFLQVKLDTSKAEAQLKNLGREFSRQVDPAQMSRAASTAVAAQSREVIAQQKAAAAAAKAAGVDATAQANVRIAELKAQAAAQKAVVEGQKVTARETVAATTAANAQTRAQAALSVEAQRTNRVLLNDALRRQRQADTAALKQQTASLKLARQEAEKLASIKSPFAQSGGILGAGAQDLFVGLGAARSGNIGYGLAAVTRYFGSMGTAAAGASVAVVGATAALATIGVTAGIAAVAIGALAANFVESGIKGATAFETLQLQLDGLLGSASKGSQEFSWLINLGKTSVVPTEQLIAADKQLLAFGVTADGTRRKLVQFVSDFGTATSATQEQIYYLTLAVSQIVAKGKADAIDLRQLANVGVGQAALLESIAKGTGSSLAEVQKKQAEGALSAQMVLAGLIEYDKKLKGTADAASQSVAGLSQNLQDIFASGLSQAFRPLVQQGSALQSFLAGLVQSLTQNVGLFDNLAFSAAKFFDALLGNGTGGNAATFIDTLFRDILPRAVDIATKAVQFLRAVISELAKDFGPLIRGAIELAQAFGPLTGVIGAQFQGLVISIVIAVRSFATLGVIGEGVLTSLVYGAQALALALTGNIGGAIDALTSSLQALALGGLRAQAIWSQANSAASSGSPGARGADLRKGTNSAAAGSPGSGLTRVVDTEATNAAQEAATKAGDAAKKVAQARDSLYELIKREFGRPSESLKSLFGDGKAFTATADSIASAASRIRDALVQIVPESSPLVAFLDSQTKNLLALAAKRDDIANKLSAAQDKLKAIVSDRDNLIKQIQDQAQSFVFSLNVGTKDTFTQLDSAGSFSKVTSPDSFAASVKKKLAAYKGFVKNIRALEKAGLDKTVIKQLLQAGPDAAGDIAAQIAAGGSSVIADLNAAQKELSKVAKDFGVEQGGVFYDAGIKQAKDIVNGLKSQLAAVTAAAKVISAAILKAISPQAAKLVDTGKAVAKSVAPKYKWIKNDVADFTSNLQSDLGNLDIFGDDTKYRDQAKAIADSIVAGFKKGLDPKSIRSAAQGAVSSGILPAFATAITYAGNLPGSLAGALAAGFELIKPRLATLWGGITSGFPSVDDIKTRLQNVLSPVIPYLKGEKKLFGDVDLWGILLKGIPGVGGILTIIKRAFSGIAPYLKKLPGQLRSSLGTSSLWSFLLAGIPSYSFLYRALSSLPKAFAAVLNLLVNAWNALDFSIDFQLPTNPILGPLSGFGLHLADIFPDIKPISLATGGIAKSPTLAVVGDAPRSSGELVAPLPPGFNIADLGGSGSTMTEVRVFIGDRELTDLVRSEVTVFDARTRRRIQSGRRS